MEVLGIEKYESEALNKLLEAFYATVCKKDGEDNEHDVLGVLIIAVDRYLINKEHKNRLFVTVSLKARAKFLGKTPTTPAQGKGKRPNQ